jgi:chorismate mutase
MTDDATRAQALLADHRAAIDRLDAILIYTLAERFAHTDAVGRLKASHALPAADPAREARQAERIARLAAEAGLDPAFAQAILRSVIAEVIRHHQTHAAAARPDAVNP